jgi:hypothetical protein
MDFLLNAIPGLAIALGLYFLYLVATKGLPAALAWVKAKWNAGKDELASLEGRFAGEVDQVHTRLDAVEAQVKVLTDAIVPKPAPAPAPQPAPAAPAPQA